MEPSVQTGDPHAEVIRRGVLAEARAETRSAAWRFTDGGTIVVSSYLAAHIRPGDEISFPLTIDSASAGTELYVRKSSSSGRASDLYQAPIRYAAQPKTALPSRIRARLPSDVAEQIDTARRSYHRFGEFSEALSQIRDRIEQEPMEREQLRSLCWNLGLPGDFDIAQISWKPDYDHFFYRQLCRRARRLYLFRDEYVFELESGIAAETPQLGHATYLFSTPQSIDGFLAAYTGATKEAIPQNHANLAERLGFLGRVVHGSNPKIWLRALRERLGETADYAAEVASD